MKNMLIGSAVLNGLCAVFGLYFILSGSEYPLAVFLTNTIVAMVNVFQVGAYDL